MRVSSGSDAKEDFPAEVSDGFVPDNMDARELQIHEHGIKKFSRLGWKRLTVVLITEAIALGTLSIPSTFATLGMVAGVICCVGIGLIAIYTSYVVGQVKVKYPHITNYADAGQVLFAKLGCGRFGYELITIMLSLQLLFLIGSHCLTGSIALITIIDTNICSIVFAVVSSVILLLLAIPPSFTEMAILGYVDFASIIIAVGVTIIGTGVQATNSTGLSNVNWSAWPKEGITFAETFISVTNIIFAYTITICQISFMDEMHTPTDFTKSVCTLGAIEMVVYTMTGALIYAFVGQDVQSPALLSAGPTLSRVVFGIALPVIFISGSINAVVFGRMIHGRIFKNSYIRFINTTMGWITWLAMLVAAIIISFIIAEVIPFFDDLLSLMCSLFLSGFTFYFPAMMWFLLIRKGSMFTPKNLALGALNVFVFLIGLVTLGAGIYSCVIDIRNKYRDGKVGGVFSCSS